MAEDVARLVVALEARTRAFEKALEKATGVTNKQAKAIEDRFAKMNPRLAAIGRDAANSLVAPLAGIGAALGTAEIAAYADAWVRAGNMIAAAGQSSGVQVRSLSELRKGADDARASFESYVELYGRLIRSASGVAKSEEEIARATSLVSKAMAAGGASAQEQAAGIQQLGQALGSGVLQGDELRSLRENAPVIVKAIADEFKTTIGGLKQLGADGELSSARVFKAILGAQEGIEAQFNQTNATIADGFTALRNAATEYVGTAAQATGATNAINGILRALAGNLEAVANTAAAAAIMLLSRYTPALIRASAAQVAIVATNPFLLLAAGIGAATFALTAFGDEIKPVEGDLANLQDYGGALWDDIKDRAAVAGAEMSDQFLGVLALISGAMGGLPVTWADVLENLGRGTNRFIGLFVGAYEGIKATFDMLPAAVGDNAIQAINAVIAAIEKLIAKAAKGINTLRTGFNALPSWMRGGVVAPMIDPPDLGRVTNTFAGAGKQAGDAFAGAFNEAMSRDYVGEFGENLKNDANLRAFVRNIDGTLDSLERGTPSTEGFGNAPPTTPSAAGGAAARTRKPRANEYERETQQIVERTAAIRAETEAQAKINPLVNDFGHAIAKARVEQELLSSAKKAGIEITPQLRAEIEQLSSAYAAAEVGSGELAEAQGKIVERAQEMAALREDALGGLIRDLAHGTSGADALSSALGKVGDKLIDMATSSLLSPSGGGGLFSALFSGLTGGLGASAAPMSATGSLWAGGGYTGDGGKHQPKGVVHGGEFVFSKASVQRIGVGNLDELHKATKGYAEGGLVAAMTPRLPKMNGGGKSAPGQNVHVTVGVKMDREGNIRPFVESIARSETRSGLDQYDSMLPDRITQVSRDPKFRG